MLRYKVVATSDKSTGTLSVRSFDSHEKVVAWINANVCVLAPEDRTALFAAGYLKLPREQFVILVTYRRPWWAPWAWIEDEGQVMLGTVLVAIGMLTLFRSRGLLLDWFPEIWMLFGVVLIVRGLFRP